VVAGGVATFAAANPYYLLETVAFHFVHADLSLSAFLKQDRDFCILACGLVALPLCAAVFRIAGLGPAQPRDCAERYWCWILAAGAAALSAGLGWHRGAYLTYYYHLVLPPLAIAAAFAAARLPRWVAAIALLANLSVLMLVAPAFPKPDPGWSALSRDVAAQHGPIVVDYMLEPLARGRGDVRTAGNGINRFAIDLPGMVGGKSRSVLAARAEAEAYVAAERERIAHGPPPAAIYMDCYLFAARPGDPRARQGQWLAVPRNEHPLPLNGYDMSRYRPTGLFILHPYYGSQNSPRQDAGTWVETIVKFSREDGTSRSPALPIVLVAPQP
jgi:hypothetical protein